MSDETSGSLCWFSRGRLLFAAVAAAAAAAAAGSRLMWGVLDRFL